MPASLYFMRKAFLFLFVFIVLIQLVNAGNCWYQIMDEPGVSPEKMKVYYNNQFVDEGNLLVVGCKVQGNNSWPEVAVLYSSGYLRLKPPRIPDNLFGSSFVLGPSYWEDGKYYHNPQIKEVRLTSSLTSWKVAAENNDFLMNYKIQISPKSKVNIAIITEKIEAKKDVQLDTSRINSSEAFKVVQVSSMYINNNTHDAEYAKYLDDSKNLNKVFLKNENGFIFSQAVKLKKILFDLVNTETGGAWQPPSITVSVNKLKNAFIQGYVAETSNSNNDNVGIWVDDNSVQNIKAGTRMTYSYKLSAY